MKLLETLVEFHQEVLPLVALTLWFAAQIEEQWQKVLRKQAPIGSIIASEQCRFQRAPRHSVQSRDSQLNPGLLICAPEAPPPLPPRR